MDPDLIDTAIATVERSGTSAETPAAQFQIFSGVLKAFEQDGVKRLSGVASSTTRDLHGDVMDHSALLDMERDANDNLTIFLNHRYDVPEDVFGSVTKAKIVPRGADQDGNPNYDLDFEIVVDEENPRALRTWTYVSKGRRLGLSIGALIPEGGAIRDKKTGALTIYHVKLLETSVVSIPANPRSWISAARKAVIKAMHDQREEQIQLSGEHTLGAPTLTLAGDQYTIRGSLNGLQLGSEPEVTAAATDPASATADPDTAASADIDPDVTDSRVRIIEIDTDDPKGSGDDDSSQEAGSSDPGAEEDEFSAGQPDVTASVEPPSNDLIEGTRKALELLQRATEELATVRAALADEQRLRKAAEDERDRVVQQSGEILAGVRTVLNRLGDTPLGRKSTVREASTSLDGLEHIYSRDFLKLLTQGKG